VSSQVSSTLKGGQQRLSSHKNKNLALPTLRYLTSGQAEICMISGLCRNVDDICALLGYYAACSGNFLATFRDNLSVPSSRAPPFKMGQIGCPETSVTNYHYTLRNIPEERRYQIIFFSRHLITAACCVRRCHSVLLCIEVPCHTLLCRVTELRQCCVYRNSRSV